MRAGEIVAVAIVRRMTVVTRNARDFRPFGVRTLDPFADRGETRELHPGAGPSPFPVSRRSDLDRKRPR